MKPRLAFASASPPDKSAERAVLAEKIAAHRSALAAIAKLEIAVQQAEDRVIQMVHGIEAAQKDLQDGPAKAADWEVQNALGNDPGRPVNLTALRSALADKREQADIQREARSRLEAALGRARTDATWSEQHVKDAALAVLRTAPNLPKMVADVEAMQARFLDIAGDFRELMSVGVLPERDEEHRFTRAKSVNEMFFRAPASWLELMKTRPPTNRWKAALEALCHDASAPLPE